MHEDLTLHYQPIYFLNSKDLLGYEALLRSHAGRPSQQVLDDARRRGCLTKLELNILERAAGEMLATSPSKLFFNVTSETARDYSFAGQMQRVLRRLGVPATRVCAEISERLLLEINDPGLFKNIFDCFVDLGFYVAVDDYGSRDTDASFTVIVDSHPDFVKIDRLLVHGVGGNPGQQRYLKFVLDAFVESGIYPILEGIEREIDRAWINSCGLDLGVQGYAFGVPAPLPAAGGG